MALSLEKYNTRIALTDLFNFFDFAVRFSFSPFENVLSKIFLSPEGKYKDACPAKIISSSV